MGMKASAYLFFVCMGILAACAYQEASAQQTYDEWWKEQQARGRVYESRIYPVMVGGVYCHVLDYNRGAGLDCDWGNELGLNTRNDK